MSGTYVCFVQREKDAWAIVLRIIPAEAQVDAGASYEVLEARIYDKAEPDIRDRPNSRNIASYLETALLDDLADLAYMEYAADERPELEPHRDYSRGTIRNHPVRNLVHA